MPWCVSSLQPTDPSFHPQHTVMLTHHWLGSLCVCFCLNSSLCSSLVFILLSPMHKCFLLRVSFVQLSLALADRGTRSLWGNALREDAFDPTIRVLDADWALLACTAPQAFPAMQWYSLASRCDKIYYFREKCSSHSAKPPTAQNNSDPQFTSTQTSHYLS